MKYRTDPFTQKAQGLIKFTKIINKNIIIIKINVKFWNFNLQCYWLWVLNLFLYTCPISFFIYFIYSLAFIQSVINEKALSLNHSHLYRVVKVFIWVLRFPSTVQKRAAQVSFKLNNLWVNLEEKKSSVQTNFLPHICGHTWGLRMSALWMEVYSLDSYWSQRLRVKL